MAATMVHLRDSVPGLQKWGFANFRIFSSEGHKLLPDYYAMVKE